MDEHAAAKQLVADFQGALAGARPQQAEAILRAHCAPDLRFLGFHPVNELRGAGGVARGFLAPLLRAFPDMWPRPYLRVAGRHREALWVAESGDLVGSFARDWLGIPASGTSVRLRYGAFFQVAQGRIREFWLLVDLIDLLRQAGIEALPPQNGRDFWIPGPLAHDGLLRAGAEVAESARSLALVEAMIAGLNAYDGEHLASMGMERFWAADFRWYGPAGIGSAFGLKEFEDFHQRPFLRAFPDRVGGTADTVWLGEGPFTACAGFPVLHMTQRAAYLGQAATGRRLGVRGMDWWTQRDGRLTENWVFVDLPHAFRQLGADLLPGPGTAE